MQQISSCPVCKQHFHGSYVCILYLYNGKEFVILVPSHNVRNYGIDYWQNICYYSERGGIAAISDIWDKQAITRVPYCNHLLQHYMATLGRLSY